MKKGFKKVFITFVSVFMLVFIFDVVSAGSTTTYMSCGDTKGIPNGLPGLIRALINIIKIGVPILMILMGSIDFGKAVIGDEKELSKATKKFTTRCIGGVGVFFVVFLVQLLLKLVGKSSDGMIECIACFTSDGSYCSTYEVENDDYSDEAEKAKKEREEIEKKREEERKKREEEAKEKEEQNKNNGGNNNGNNGNDNGNSGGNNPVKPGESITSVSTGMTLRTFTGSKTLKYWEYIPNNPRENMALIIFLHGSGECGSPNSMKSVSFSKFMNEGVYANYPAVFIAPNTTSGSCNWTDKAVALKELIDTVVDKYKIDKNHIIITGHSLGAIGTWNMVSDYPGFFSAAVPVSCCEYGHGVATNFKGTPVRAYVGASESGYTGCMQSFVNSINNSGGKATYIAEPSPYNTHSSVVNIYKRDELINWMLTQ